MKAKATRADLSERGAALLAAIKAKRGSIAKFARALDCDPATVRRAVRARRPIRMQIHIVEAFEREGISRELLPLAG